MDISFVLSEWRWWTDANQNSYQKGCTDASKDQWVQNRTKCDNGYSYLLAGSNDYGNNYCLLYPEWSASQASSRYSTKPSKCSPSGSNDFTSINTASDAYYSKITSYTQANKDLLNKLKNVNSDLDSGFSSMATKLLNSIQQIQGILTPLVNIFNTIVGENGFFTLINCSNLYKFYFFSVCCNRCE